MKLVEQYVIAVSKRLPLKGRKEVKNELRSLILDELEERFIIESTTDESKESREKVKEYLKEFGSPAEVAARYAGENFVIPPAMTELFFLLTKVMLGAMAIAFITLFIVQFIADNLSGSALFQAIMNIPLQVAGAWFSGVGVVTLLFIAASRFLKMKDINSLEQWDPAELEDIEVEEKLESRLEGILSIGFSFILIVLMLSYPQIVSFAEDSFAITGFSLNHHIVVDTLIRFVPFMVMLWMLEIAVHFMIMRQESRTPRINIAELILHAAGLALMITLLNTADLWRVVSDGWIGFKTIFLIVMVVEAAELITSVVRLVKPLVSKYIES